jgi:nickel-dependent lactate racemase
VNNKNEFSYMGTVSLIVNLPFGETYIKFKLELDGATTVLEPKKMVGIADAPQALKRSLLEPINSTSLQELAKNSKHPCIIVSDSTRPTPSGLIAEAALEQLHAAGVNENDVTIVVATGLHRQCDRSELTEMLGARLVRRLKVVNHVAAETQNLVKIGDTERGTPLWLNKNVFESDLVIGDGYIEPHFFAGYTGGGKNILPGVSGLETIMKNHSSTMIDDKNSRSGILEDNPIYCDIVDGARIAGYDFSINVTLNNEKRVSGVFSGDFESAHRAGSRFLEKYIMAEAKPAEIVVTTNGGYPLDRDLYQSVKGMTVGESVVKEGGVIIVTSECRDGVGHADFKKLVIENDGPESILEEIRTPGFNMIDQWQAQILARVLLRAEVIMVTSVIEAETIRRMHMTPAKDLKNALKKAKRISGRDPQMCVIPGGPSIIPKTT